MAEIKPLRILAIEGPAGAGKSTLIARLLDEFNHLFRGTDPIVPVQRPRDYSTDNTNGANISIIKDYAHFMSAVGQWKYSPNKIYLIDRFIWSQYVYGSLRLGRYTPGDIARGYYVSVRAMEHILDDYLARRNVDSIGSWEQKQIPELKISTLFYLPPVETIKLRRATVDREFIYSAERERSWYEGIIRNCGSTAYWDIMVRDENLLEHIRQMLKFFNIKNEGEE